MMAKPDVSIIIVSYNVKDYLMACLASLEEQQGVAMEVIVVDNDSHDASVDMVREKYPLVQLIGNTENKGFSAANNQGIAIANGYYVFLLNPDTVVKEGAIRKLTDFMNAYPDAAMAGPRLLNEDGSLQPSYWHFPNLAGMASEAFFLSYLFPAGERRDIKKEEPEKVNAVSGAAMFIRNRPDLALDEHLFWMEDTDLCFRLHPEGIYFLPSAEIIHFGGGSSAGKKGLTIANQLTSKVKFFRKHHGRIPAFIASCLVSIQIVLRLLVFGPFSVLGKTFSGHFRAYAFAGRFFFRYIRTGDQRVVP